MRMAKGVCIVDGDQFSVAYSGADRSITVTCRRNYVAARAADQERLQISRDVSMRRERARSLRETGTRTRNMYSGRFRDLESQGKPIPDALRGQMEREASRYEDEARSLLREANEIEKAAKDLVHEGETVRWKFTNVAPGTLVVDIGPGVAL